MEISRELIEKITRLVVDEVQSKGIHSGTNSQVSPTGRKENTTSQEINIEETPSKYSTYKRAEKGSNPKEVVIGVGPAFQREIKRTITGICLDEVLDNIKAGIEEEGMVARVVKVLKTSDVCFMGLEAAKLSGSGFGIGIQSKGTTVIHQKDLYPLSNLELFPQAPLMTLETYRKIGKNAAKYVKGEKVSPIEGVNDPMVRAKYQVKAALMHIKETEQVDHTIPYIEWEDKVPCNTH